MNPLNAYKETHIKTASQGKLVVMLYDEAIKQLDKAVENLKAGVSKYDLVNNAIIKAQDVITELMVSLDFEKGTDISKNLFSLYTYFNQQLMEGNLQKNDDPLKRTRIMLAELRDAWHEAHLKVGTTRNPSEIGGVNIAG